MDSTEMMVARAFQTVKDLFDVHRERLDWGKMKALLMTYRLLAAEFRNDLTPETVGFLVGEFGFFVRLGKRGIVREALNLLKTITTVSFAEDTLPSNGKTT